MKRNKIDFKQFERKIPKGTFSCKAVMFYINDTIPVLCDDLYNFDKTTNRDCRCSSCNMFYRGVKKHDKKPKPFEKICL